MKLSGLTEEEILNSLLRHVPCLREAPVPIGDDCAVVEPEKKKRLSVYKTDCLIEGVHFLKEHSPEQIGWKALCRVLSDLAAMSATPHHALVTLAAPETCELEMLEGIYRGIGKAAEKYDVLIAGGETARSPSGIFLSISVIGSVRKKRMVTRSGGKAGDVLFVTGRLGGSIKGHHLTFSPRLDESQWLTKNFEIHAMMDLSDGLASDLPRMADASGTGFALDVKRIPRMPLCSVQNALTDGEDYELLFAVSGSIADSLEKAWKSEFPDLNLSRIGELTADRKERTVLGTGFQHF